MKAKATDTTYQKQWKEINQLINDKKLPKSALAKVKTLYTRAKKDNNPSQTIKTLLYQVSLNNNINDDNEATIIAFYTKELSTSKNDEAKALLNLLLADAYTNAYNHKRWEYKNRTTTKDYISTNYKTWTEKNFIDKVVQLLQQTFSNQQQLQKIELKDFDAIVIKGTEPQLRPTLYDIMAFDAIEMLSNFIETEASTNNNLLSNYNTFCKESFTKISENNATVYAIELYQSILNFHAKDKQQDALIDADISRINWVKEHFNFDDEGLYLNAIEHIITYGKNNPAADEAHYLLANHHYTKGEEFNYLEDTTNRYELVEAKKIIDERLKNQPLPSSGKTHLQNLSKQILASSLAAKVEKVNVPNQDFRMLVEFKNVDTLYYRIIKLNKKDKEKNSGEEYWKAIQRKKFIKEATQQLPIATDYQGHAVEIKIDALPVGEYLILGSNGATFNDSLHHLFTVQFTVSNLSLINTGKDYFVLNRETGHPIENATIKISTFKVDKNDKEVETIAATYKTDSNGYANIESLPFNGYTSYVKTIQLDNDVLKLQDYYEYYYDRNNQPVSKNFEKENVGTEIFTDRAIYRPGQTVFFKALFTTKDSINFKPKLYLPKGKITVLLKDANYKQIDSLKLAVNQFGTINGTFKLPQNSLTGNFSIEIQEGNVGRKYFNVEEYKRSTFYIEFEKIKEAYRLNDSIKIKGNVKAYAGNASNNALVKYTIERSGSNNWDYKRRFYSSEKQITAGEIKTADDGTFEFVFKAEPDKTIKHSNKKDEYSFKVTVVVTDINGETRTETTTYSIGNTALKIDNTIANKNNATHFKQFTVKAENVFGEKQEAQIQLKIIALQTPERPIRERLWNKPDMFIMSKEVFVQHFPYDEYENETDYTTWQKGNIVFETTINTARTDTVALPNNLPQGFYTIEMIAKDKFGETVTNTSYTELYDLNSSNFSKPDFNWNYTLDADDNFSPKDTVTVLVGSSAKDVFVIKNLTQQKPSVNGKKAITSSLSFGKISNEKAAWDYVVSDEDKGGFAMFYAFVKHNRFYSGGNSFNVPFAEKHLQIELATYRNKTEPGSKETWNIKVKGLNNTKAEAELLTAMYDVSLDQFRKTEWDLPYLWAAQLNLNNHWQATNNFEQTSSQANYLQEYYEGEVNKHNILIKNVNNLYFSGNGGAYNFVTSKVGFLSFASSGDHVIRRELRNIPGVQFDRKNLIYRQRLGAANVVADMNYFNGNTFQTLNNDGVSDKMDNKPYNSKPQTPSIQPRKNLQETAFFIPTIYADKEGNYTFSFTMPEALTQWRWMNFGHTKDLATGYNEAIITTQKALMVQPNLPRFLREGDNIELVTKIANLSEKEITGQCTLELVDATTGNVVDGWFQNGFATQFFTAAALKNTTVKFPLQIPYNFNKPITIRIVAKASSPSPVEEGKGEVDFSDGEETTIPVLTNRMLVTETLPLYLKPAEKSKEFNFSKLINNTSETLQHQSLTVEYTANPIWSVVKSLPYLMEYPYECAEQTFNRLFANALATNIVNNHPKIKAVFEVWANDSTANSPSFGGIREAILQETPWVLDAENEAQQQKNIALLYDVVTMSKNINSIVEKLKQMQLSNGAFPWFKGGHGSRYITNYIATGIGKLKKLNAIQNDELDKIATKAIQYLDEQIQQEYASLKKEKVDLSKQHIYSSQIDYLYMKSFYSATNKNSEAYRYYYNQAKNYWQKQNSYYTALIGTVLYRNNERRLVNVNIIPSIIENTIEDTTLGTVKWKQQQTCFWYNAPFEHQSTMIAFLQEIYNQEKISNLPTIIDAAKTWLMLNKQTNNWQTTVATAEACYALLFSGSNWISNSQQVNIKLGSLLLTSSKGGGNNPTGYFKQRIDAENIQPKMGNVQVVVQQLNNQTVKQSSPSYGAIYWQYFEDLDKITVSDSAAPLHLVKKIFKEITTAKGKELQLINENDELKIGDKIIVRLELTSNRTMEYLHLKDMRASGSEPVNVLSGYKWQDGLGYYEATKDASTNFFIDRMEKGIYVFQYPLYVAQAGVFSVGIANIQCMYAPEFTSHSEGIKIRVVE